MHYYVHFLFLCVFACNSYTILIFFRSHVEKFPVHGIYVDLIKKKKSAIRVWMYRLLA